MNKQLQRDDLVHPELSYKIIGILFDVYNNLGYGQSEKTYQKATAIGFKNAGIQFREQVYMPLIYGKEKIGNHYFDFLIENKIILEIKKGNRFAKSHIEQVYAYLKNGKLQLGILAYFAPRNLHFKRIVNL